MKALLAAAALAGLAASPLAARADEPATALTQILAAHAHLSIVDDGGHPIGQLVPVSDDSFRLRVIGATRSTPAQRSDRTFNLDERGALTPLQQNAAYQDAVDRLINPAGNAFGP